MISRRLSWGNTPAREADFPGYGLPSTFVTFRGVTELPMPASRSARHGSPFLQWLVFQVGMIISCLTVLGAANRVEEYR